MPIWKKQFDNKTRNGGKERELEPLTGGFIIHSVSVSGLSHEANCNIEITEFPIQRSKITSHLSHD